MPFRSLQRPLTPDQLRPLEPGLTRLQFSAGLTDEEYRAVARLLEPRPDVTLRAYGGYGWTLQDLEWLRWFPGLRRVAIDALWGVLRDPDGLRFLPDDLEELGLGKLKPPFDLRTIARFRSLRRLGLEGPVRHAEAISAFTELEALLLRSVTLPDLSPLRSMRALRRLDLKLGGTCGCSPRSAGSRSWRSGMSEASRTSPRSARSGRSGRCGLKPCPRSDRSPTCRGSPSCEGSRSTR